MANNWYVITGGPSSGKTTLLLELQKAGHKTVPEAARTLIDRALERGISVADLRADEKHFQEEVARLKEKIELDCEKNVLTFFDRGMHDSLAYMRHYEFNIEMWLEELMKGSTYRKVFLLDPLPVYQADYARTEDKKFSKDIHKLLKDAYSEFGMKPIRIPVVSPKERAKMVLSMVSKEADN